MPVYLYLLPLPKTEKCQKSTKRIKNQAQKRKKLKFPVFASTPGLKCLSFLFVICFFNFFLGGPMVPHGPPQWAPWAPLQNFIKHFLQVYKQIIKIHRHIAKTLNNIAKKRKIEMSKIIYTSRFFWGGPMGPHGPPQWAPWAPLQIF